MRSTHGPSVASTIPSADDTTTVPAPFKAPFCAPNNIASTDHVAFSGAVTGANLAGAVASAFSLAISPADIRPYARANTSPDDARTNGFV